MTPEPREAYFVIREQIKYMLRDMAEGVKEDGSTDGQVMLLGNFYAPDAVKDACEQLAGELETDV